MSKSIALFLTASTLAALFMPEQANAVTIVDTGPQASDGFSWVSNYQSIAGLFTINGNYKLTSISYFGGGTGSLTINIRNNGDMPGSVIYSRNINTDIDWEDGPRWRVFDDIAWSLNPGSYYISVETKLSPATVLVWGVRFKNPLANEQYGYMGVWEGKGSANTSTLGSGFGFRISGDAVSTSPVPEASSWGMMFAGLAGAGAILRGRRKREALKLA